LVKTEVSFQRQVLSTWFP